MDTHAVSSPSHVGSDAIAGWTVAEFNQIIRHLAGLLITELFCVRRTTTYLTSEML